MTALATPPRRISTREELDRFKQSVDEKVAAGKEGINESFISQADITVINDVIMRSRADALRTGGYLDAAALTRYFNNSSKVRNTDRGQLHYRKALDLILAAFDHVTLPQATISEIFATSPDRETALTT